ncbi:MFS transporter [Glutamicibacter halophytocola]|uniref:MFS transporter n=1 Tax=Glutamicibacter halophytocola TaxID=1933880 RepID=UPI00321A70D7
MTALLATHRSRTIVYFICWLSLIADGYDLYVYGTTPPAIIGQEPFNATAAQAGAVGSLALVGMLIGSLVVGILTDKLGRRRILIGSVLLFSTFMLACAFAPTWELFAAARFIACFGVGGLLPTAVALANEFALPERKSLTLGIVLTGPALGTVAASLSSMLLIENYSFRPVYALGCFGFLACGLGLEIPPRVPGLPHGRRAPGDCPGNFTGLRPGPPTGGPRRLLAKPHVAPRRANCWAPGSGHAPCASGWSRCCPC